MRAVSEHDATSCSARLRAADPRTRMSERARPARSRAWCGAWRTLAPDAQRLAAVAALGAVRRRCCCPGTREPVRGRVHRAELGRARAFGAFSFVEAAVLLVAVGVLVLLFARAEGRAFHLPGGDGAVVMAAGVWVALLLVWRLFDRPDVGRRAARRRRSGGSSSRSPPPGCSPTPARACAAPSVREPLAAPRRRRAPAGRDPSPAAAPAGSDRDARPAARATGAPARGRSRGSARRSRCPRAPSASSGVEHRRAAGAPPYHSPSHVRRAHIGRGGHATACARSATCPASRPRSSPTWPPSSASPCSSRARRASARPSWRRRSRATSSATLVRLQCYEGLDEAKALYEWNYRKQLLRIQAEASGTGWEAVQEDIFGEEFLLARPLMTAIASARAGRAADRRDRQDRPGVRGDAARAAVRLPDLDPRARARSRRARSRSCC